MGMVYGLEKGQCSEADLQKCIRSVPKAHEPFVLGRYIVLFYEKQWQAIIVI